MRAARLLSIAVLLAACVTVQPLATQPEASPGPQTASASAEPSATATVQVIPTPDATMPTASATASAEPSATATPQVVPDSPPPATAPPVTQPPGTPGPDPSAEKGVPIMMTWPSNGFVTAQVLLPVTNTGGTWIKLLEFDSSFTIYDASGSAILEDIFYASAPKVIAPTGTSYLVGESFTDDHPLDAYVTVEADAHFAGVEAPAPEDGLVAENIRTRGGSFNDVVVVGEIRNLGTETVEDADVVAIFFDASGSPIGFAFDFVEDVAPGGTQAFEVATNFAGIVLGDIAETQVFASAWDF